jgi:hypothetical protein
MRDPKKFCHYQVVNIRHLKWNIWLHNYRGADKSLVRPGRKQLQRQKILIFIYPIYNYNWRNISTIYMYNKTTSNEVGRAKDLSAPRGMYPFCLYALYYEVYVGQLCTELNDPQTSTVHYYELHLNLFSSTTTILLE